MQVGDRLLVAGVPSEDGKSIAATTAVLMKKADVAGKQQHDREDWQKNGVAGVVKAVDPTAGTITISTGTLAANVVTINVAKDTVIRRYAPNSVKFDDAKPGTLDQIKAGDQLRARGTKSADGKEINAAEIVSGTFRSIPATLLSADTASNTITVTDLVRQASGDSEDRRGFANASAAGNVRAANCDAAEGWSSGRAGSQWSGRCSCITS